MSNSNIPPTGEQKNAGLVFAADIGGTHLRAAAVDCKGQIRYRFKQNTPRAEKPQEIVSTLVSAARECEKQGSEIGIVSVVVPGTVNAAEGVVIKAPNVACLNGFPLAAALANELNKPAILENDANAAAVGEMWQGAARDYKTIVCITLGTGVGGGIVLEGKLWRGVDGSAGEIGHTAVDPFGGIPCCCGSSGCLEVYASATAIVRLTREGLPRYPDSILGRSPQLTAADVYTAGTDGARLAPEVFERMGAYLGDGCANLINLLNPEMIVIGGGVANGWDLFETPMWEEIKKRAFPLPAERVRIVPAECGDDAGLLGAARLALS